MTALLLTLLPPTTAAAEEPAEQIGEIAEVADVEVEAAARLSAARTVRPEGVVLLALVGVLHTSYADWTSLKRASAPLSPGLRSG